MIFGFSDLNLDFVDGSGVNAKREWTQKATTTGDPALQTFRKCPGHDPEPIRNSDQVTYPPTPVDEIARLCGWPSTKSTC